VQVIERFQDFTLIEAEPKTGRTHQIRIHLSALGHPLVGEQLYVKQETKPPMLQRHFLHASYLEFRHPRTGEKLSFTSPLPDELEELLHRLPVIPRMLD
jgi:23S rRNA-/tRNA-specific pseudouridylate synthase